MSAPIPPSRDDRRAVDRRTLGSDASAPLRRSHGSDPLVGSFIGDYQIRRVIGRGGMGSVYEALHVHLLKSVAIKVLASHLLDDPRAIERFRREMRAIGSVDSPYIVRALDASLTGDVQYLVMEYVDGIDADELVRRLHGIPVEDACEIVRQAALGLDDAHRHQLVHRDIKPKNLAVSTAGKVKLLDLGLALCKSDVVATGRLTEQAAIGSYQYMAPEQFDDSHEVDIRADLYSLGCTLFHLLTGNPPFSGKRYRTLTSLMDAHRSESPPPVNQFNGMASAELVQMIDQLLAKNPDERIQTPAEVAQRLEALARGANLSALVTMARSTEMVDETTRATRVGEVSTDPSRISAPPAWTPADLAPTTWARGKAKPRRWLWIASALAVVAVGLGILGLVQYQSMATAKERRRVADFVQLAPGLNGNWWVDETPWLLPGVRVTAADALGDDVSNLPVVLRRQVTIPAQMLQDVSDLLKGPDVQRLQWSINTLVSRLVTFGSPAVRDGYYFIQKDDPETIDEAKLRGKLSRIAEWHRPASGEASPIDDHVQAIALHKEGHWDEAEEYYQKALAGFDALDQVPLAASLCSADYGEVLWLMGRYDDAALRFRVAVAKLQDIEQRFPEFVAYALGREADCLRKSVDSISLAGATLDRADAVARSLAADHPLRAHLAERRAWLALDSWDAQAAVDALKPAVAIRQRSMELGNPRAQVFFFLDRQGVAMAERILGNEAKGEELLRSLSADIARVRTDSTNYSAKQRSDLNNRQLNVLERLADVPLFGSGELALAVEPLEKALVFADGEPSSDSRLSRHIDRIRFKLAIALAARGDVDQAVERMRQAKGTELISLEVGYREAAEGAIELARSQPAGGKQIAELIQKMDPDRSTRDDLELMFLATKSIYSSPTASDEDVATVIRREAQMLQSLQRRGRSESLLVYLRSHYDAMIRRALRIPGFPARDLAGLVLAAKGRGSKVESFQGIAFHWWADDGLLVDLSESPTVHPLSFGYRKLLDAAHAPLSLETLNTLLPADAQLLLKNRSPDQIEWDDPTKGIRPAAEPKS